MNDKQNEDWKTITLINNYQNNLNFNVQQLFRFRMFGWLLLLISLDLTNPEKSEGQN